MPHIIKALDRKTFGSGIKVPAIHVFILRDEFSWIIVKHEILIVEKNI